MSISEAGPRDRIVDVSIDDEKLTAFLADGREISVPIIWYPRLDGATREQRDNWELSAAGYGVHWPDLDEDLSAEGLLRGAPAARPIVPD